MSDSKQLPVPVEISEQRWGDDVSPVCSIICSTYNHGAYIEECIKSFLMQKTSFPVEILIHDDASQDGTAEIVRKYQGEYPNLINATLQVANQYSKGFRPGAYLRSLARGEFIAFCEGDDFWTDPDKLEKQVSYLRRHPEVVLSFHDVICVDEKGTQVSDSKIFSITGKKQPELLNDYELIVGSLIPTVAAVFRNLPVVMGPKGRYVVSGDTYLFAMLARYGSMHDMRECMAAHRGHAGGVWTSASSEKRTKTQLSTFEAIAHEIDPSNVLVASYLLADISWNAFRASLRNRDVPACLLCLRYYLVSICCSFRYLDGGEQPVSSILRGLSNIMMLPLRSLRSVIRR